MNPSDWDGENLDALKGLHKGDVEPLITLLEEAERPLHPELRRWLARMLVGDPQVSWWLQCKRHPGFPKPDNAALELRDIRIGLCIHELWHEGATITEAKDQAAEKFKRKSRTIDDAWTDYRRLYFRLKDEGTDFFPQWRPLRGSPKRA